MTAGAAPPPGNEAGGPAATGVGGSPPGTEAGGPAATGLGGSPPGTEAADPSLADLDRRPAAEIVRAVVEGHDEVVAAVRAAEAEIAALVDAVELLTGRLVYAGAGSGGRVAAMDAAEWGPTFGVPDGRVVALLAGADEPPGSAAEAAAEDDAAAGAADVEALALTPEDVVVGISASGSTRYVLGAIEVAIAAGALTAAVTCQPGSPLSRMVDVTIDVPVGPEVVSGSTRLKAGTAQKIVLNAFSTALMVRRGRTVGALMAGMRVANEKLRGRAARVCVQATGCSEPAARAALEDAGWELDTALVMLAAGVGAEDARSRLQAHDGAVREAMES
jgi:N-acetylmuramic acid 6-phosphate etherase